MNSNWEEIECLVRQAQNGDRDAFGELFERFRGSVYAVARSRQRDADEAAELVQEVFLHAMRKIGQLREANCFAAWLQRITVRVAINRGTRRPPLSTTESEVLEQEAGAGRTPLEDLMHNEQRAIVREAVASLREIDRDALMDFYLKGKSLAQIAYEREIPLGTVKRRLHVARRRLEETLRPIVVSTPDRSGVEDMDDSGNDRPRSRNKVKSKRKRTLALC